MTKIIKTLLVVMVVFLALAAFVACEQEQQGCQHTGGTATCTEAAVCEICGESYGEAAGHKVAKLPAIEATCSKEGRTEGSRCSECKETLVPQETIEKLEHVWVANTQTKEPTCTEPGYTGGNHCENCGVQDGTLIILEPECKWSEPFLYSEATCDQAGVMVSECVVCGKFKVDSYVNATGHTWADATCAAPKTCETCGATEGEALAHTWADATCTAPKTCETCGATEGEALGHTPGAEATCTTAQICTVCEVELVAKLGHNYVDNVCTICGDEMLALSNAVLDLTTKDNRTYYDAQDKQVWEQNGVKLTNTKGEGTSAIPDKAPFEAWANGYIIIEGKGMKTIQIVAQTTTLGTFLSRSLKAVENPNFTYSSNGTTYTIVFNEEVDIFELYLTHQTAFKSITINPEV